MPVARTNPRRALVVGLAAIVFALGLIAVVLVANGAGNTSQGGSFDSARVDDLIRLQERDGDVPALFPDPVGGRQPIFVFHLGDDPDEGWIAYDAIVDGEPLVLDLDELVLRGPDGTEYPFTGDGLPQYPAEVVDGRLVVDLSGERNDGDGDGSTTTTTLPTSTTTG